jgi:hypothetical protein
LAQSQQDYLVQVLHQHPLLLVALFILLVGITIEYLQLMELLEFQAGLFLATYLWSLAAAAVVARFMKVAAAAQAVFFILHLNLFQAINQ